MANHRPDLVFGRRYSAMRERVAALRSLLGPAASTPRPTDDRTLELLDRYTPLVADLDSA
ncbi:MAG: hypothetical protein ACFCVK_03520 [Acidimicrobiales bacterium]